MPRHVVYLRFPIPRNGVEDPPVIAWTHNKERKLWSILQGANVEIDWTSLAERFDVPVVYILQQAAWLYEKELKLLREKMTQISTRNTIAPNTSTAGPQSRSSPRTSVVDRRLSASNVPGSMAGVESPVYSTRSSTSTLSNPGDRLLSASRIYHSDEATQSEASVEAFLPDVDSDSKLEDLISSSDNSVTRSALEEALMSRPYRVDSPPSTRVSNNQSSPGGSVTDDHQNSRR